MGKRNPRTDFWPSTFGDTSDTVLIDDRSTIRHVRIEGYDSSAAAQLPPRTNRLSEGYPDKGRSGAATCASGSREICSDPKCGSIGDESVSVNA